MNYYYNPEVKYLLLSEPFAKESVLYNHNQNAFHAPQITFRPPYYTNPQYVPYYTVL
ncbi:hypothetical protein MUN88_04230 [Gracilibacillus caseinilyticus]|uniref:Uncharacterized protein n=1 Tax=Gracilibacillus caseinilyticus TaxID=2932256 RepID=A0ABY4EYH1_9BACI|nr:hypothetical protein [Gracilibacillus caseinilyticus]UOQ49335.1 hypothetical protein MUN88_04230 [Gracilibacillus caseinilyticus]